MYIQSYYHMLKRLDIRWSRAKSARLKSDRGLSFEEILRERLVSILAHPTRANQSILLYEVAGYIWVVPCVERAGELFLKTMFPSRKYTKAWRKGALT